MNRGRGGLEQEDWARYYARCCSPANRLMSRCGRYEIDWSEPGKSRSLTKKYPQPTTRGMSELLTILRVFSSSELSILLVVSRLLCWVSRRGWAWVQRRGVTRMRCQLDSKAIHHARGFRDGRPNAFSEAQLHHGGIKLELPQTIRFLIVAD